jgi:hypothetical protein
MGNYATYKANQNKIASNTNTRSKAETPAEYAIKAGISSADLKRSGSSSATIAAVQKSEQAQTSAYVAGVVTPSTSVSFPGQISAAQAKTKILNLPGTILDTFRNMQGMTSSAVDLGFTTGENLIKGIFGVKDSMTSAVKDEVSGQKNNISNWMSEKVESFKDAGQKAYDAMTAPLKDTAEKAETFSKYLKYTGIALILVTLVYIFTKGRK